MANNNHKIDDIVRFIVSAKGKLPLAVERYNKSLNSDITEEEFIALAMTEPSALFGQLKLSLVLKLYDQMMQTQIAITASLSDLKTGDLVRLYTGQMTAFGSLTNRTMDDDEKSPTDFVSAKQNLIDRLEGYKKRKLGEAVND